MALLLAKDDVVVIDGVVGRAAFVFEPDDVEVMCFGMPFGEEKQAHYQKSNNDHDAHDAGGNADAHRGWRHAEDESCEICDW